MPSPLVPVLDAYTAARRGSGHLYPTPVDGLTFMRVEDPTGPLYGSYDVCLCVVAQGAKQGSFDGATVDYAPGAGLVVGVDVPVMSHVTRASPEEPFLSLKLSLDVDLLSEMAEDVPPPTPAAPGVVDGVRVVGLSRPAEEALTRLAALAQAPGAVEALQGPRLREAYYWLLRGPSGPALARIARPEGAPRRIADAVRRMKEAFPGPVRVADLAAAADMGRASFHTHFKAVTGMSPIQYYKRLRLLEARRLLLNEPDTTARDVAYRVGYESPSHFNRDYARQFGTTPGRDAQAP